MRVRISRKVILLAVAGALILGAAGIGVALATDSPAFCNSCHEMKPFHEAWADGAHAGTPCISCHVGTGVPARLKHKLVALGQLREHVFGDPKFPLATAIDVPDERCVACHTSIETSATGFSHAAHAKKGRCYECHAQVGHAVSAAALAEVGVLNATAGRARLAAKVAAVGRGRADLAGHARVACDSCHFMRATACESCHTARHTRTPTSTVILAVYTGAEGTRPVGITGTATAGLADVPCSACHTPDAEWAFAHPTSDACTNCHVRPAGHKGTSCTTCHAAGSWEFRHPGSGSTCTSCHARPSGHKSGRCATCHRSLGKSWAFSHPSGASCTSCHTRPADHSGRACTTCHRPGSSWRFTHPGSGFDCTGCHARPTGHYGTSCASCHSPSRVWSSATFSHPSIPGGGHTYRSFACANCHPSGYSSYTCARCHDSVSGPTRGEDD